MYLDFAIDFVVLYVHAIKYTNTSELNLCKHIILFYITFKGKQSQKYIFISVNCTMYYS